jgi:23S rRNA pseudouridine1911/1915/1917 synthase
VRDGQHNLINPRPDMPSQSLHVLYEDNHLLVLNKPAGLPTMGTPEGTPTLLTLAKEYVKQKYQKPGNVYLGVVSRLDAPVTGVVLFARTSKAAARLSEQFRTQAVQKIYWALVEAAGHPASGSFVDWLVHDERHRRVHVAETGQPDGKEARLAFRQIAQDGRFSLLEIELETGRKHQIRVQFAHNGQPIVGDRKYGSTVKFAAGIALHARRLVIAHPVRGDAMEFIAPLPKYWPAGFRALES